MSGNNDEGNLNNFEEIRQCLIDNLSTIQTKDESGVKGSDLVLGDVGFNVPISLRVQFTSFPHKISSSGVQQTQKCFGYSFPGALL